MVTNIFFWVALVTNALAVSVGLYLGELDWLPTLNAVWVGWFAASLFYRLWMEA